MKIDDVQIKKMHHRDGPDTERAAAHKVARRVSGRRLQVLSALFSLRQGGTSEDISTCSGLSILSVRPRLTELQEMNLIADSLARSKNTWGNSEIVWKITDEGEKIVREL